MGTDACAGPMELNKCYRFESVNFEGHYIKNKGSELWKASGIGGQHRSDSTYKVVAAINGDEFQVSLESISNPNHYVTHASLVCWIKPCSGDDNGCKREAIWVKRDASWIVRKGFLKSPFCEDTVSFESDNFPGYFLRHTSHRMKISPFAKTDIYQKDASWVYHEVSCSTDFKCAAQ